MFLKCPPGPKISPPAKCLNIGPHMVHSELMYGLLFSRVTEIGAYENITKVNVRSASDESRCEKRESSHDYD